MLHILAAVLLNVFSIAVIQCADKSNLIKNKFILAHHCRLKFIQLERSLGGKSLGQPATLQAEVVLNSLNI